MDMQNSSTSEISLKRYSNEDKTIWDACNDVACNQNLLFYRNFMDYHAYKFEDHSLLAYNNQRLLGVFPANVRNRTLYSHQGLTFGGFLHGNKVYVSDVVGFYVKLKNYLYESGFTRLVCKIAPFPYTRYPCEASLYALRAIGAEVIERHINAAIDLHMPLAMNSLRRRNIQKARKNGIEVADSLAWDDYLQLLAENLKRHSTAPKHTAGELALLQERFPKHIRLVTAQRHGKILAGVLLFLSHTFAHTQYICSTPAGRETGALDLLIATLIEEQRLLRRYFCFGISTEGDGSSLNYGLMHQKEGFGARAVIQDIYQLDLLEAV